MKKKTTTAKQLWTMFVTKEEGAMDNVREKETNYIKLARGHDE